MVETNKLLEQFYSWKWFSELRWTKYPFFYFYQVSANRCLATLLNHCNKKWQQPKWRRVSFLIYQPIDLFHAILEEQRVSKADYCWFKWTLFYACLVIKTVHCYLFWAFCGRSFETTPSGPILAWSRLTKTL